MIWLAPPHIFCCARAQTRIETAERRESEALDMAQSAREREAALVAARDAARQEVSASRAKAKRAKARHGEELQHVRSRAASQVRLLEERTGRAAAAAAATAVTSASGRHPHDAGASASAPVASAVARSAQPIDFGTLSDEALLDLAVDVGDSPPRPRPATRRADSRRCGGEGGVDRGHASADSLQASANADDEAPLLGAEIDGSGVGVGDGVAALPRAEAAAAFSVAAAAASPTEPRQRREVSLGGRPRALDNGSGSDSDSGSDALPRAFVPGAHGKCFYLPLHFK